MLVKDVKKAILALRNASITPMLVGHHGVGKSSIVKELGKDIGYKVIDLRLGNMEIGDLLGLPSLEGGTTHFNPPEWFPKEGEKVVLFLDEINRARRDVLQASFQLVLDRQLGQAHLPDDCFVVAAMNPDTEDYSVSHFADKAFMSRFCHIVVESSASEWLAYGRSKTLNEDVLGFIASQPNMLRKTNSPISLKYVEPCDRTVEMVSRLLAKNEDMPTNIRNELIAGLAGSEWLGAFLNFLSTRTTPLSGEQVVDEYAKHRPTLVAMLEQNRIDYVNAVKDNVFEYIKDKHEMTDIQLTNTVDMLCDMPDDILVGCLQRLFNEVPSFALLKHVAEDLESNKGKMSERTKDFPDNCVKIA